MILKNELQRKIFESNYRHICGSGGFGNGKTYGGCIKILTLLTTFNKSRAIIGRLRGTDLNRTTRSTFFQICPPELYDESKGGRRVDSQNYLRLINGSEVFWMHFEDFDEGSLRGLEANFCLLDQAEEISENIFLVLDSRIGRWMHAEVPKELLEKYPDWPTFNGKPKVPAYTIILCNPDTKAHWIYRRFHPDSLEWQQKYKDSYIMYEAATDENLIDPEIIKEMKSRDPSWVSRYFYGKWGINEGTIHQINSLSKLYVTQDWVDNLIKKSSLYRVLDHGESSPTCCLWVAVHKGMYFIYREYYAPNRLISEHREAIAELSKGERYVANFADPSIFKKTSQKYGGRWSVADEYLDTNITSAPPIAWIPADNNEFSTRNRINEMLKISPTAIHPLSGELGAPRLYFIMRSNDYPNGCHYSVLETESQKRECIGTDNGAPIFSDNRDDSVPDHAYDCVRYFFSTHTLGNSEPKLKPPPGSFLYVLKEAKRYAYKY